MTNLNSPTGLDRVPFVVSLPFFLQMYTGIALQHMGALDAGCFPFNINCIHKNVPSGKFVSRVAIVASAIGLLNLRKKYMDLINAEIYYSTR